MSLGGKSNLAVADVVGSTMVADGVLAFILPAAGELSLAIPLDGIESFIHGLPDDLGCVIPDAVGASLSVCLIACTRALVEGDGKVGKDGNGLSAPIGSVPYGAFLGYEPNLPASGSHNVVGFG